MENANLKRNMIQQSDQSHHPADPHLVVIAEIRRIEDGMHELKEVWEERLQSLIAPSESSDAQASFLPAGE
jgi:hypothetical protein